MKTTKILSLNRKQKAIVAGSTVKFKLELTGNFKSNKPMTDLKSGMGNRIHLIFNNQL